MKRPEFIAALTATAAAIATGMASAKSPPLPTIAKIEGRYPALDMWHFDGGAPWVVAATAEDARRAYAREWAGDNGVGERGTRLILHKIPEPRRMDYRATFVMHYEDPECIEEGLTRDDPTANPCLGCGGRRRRASDECCVTVTMTCGAWAAFLGESHVIGEFQG